jgi:ABC-type transporter Mla maintaining outer membrane lipid asymmetry ATPase subunit MlaF
MEVMLVSSQPFLRNLVVLDEPFSMVEPDHLPAVGELIHQLNRRLGVQFIINVVIGSSGMVLMDVSDAAFLVRGGKVEQIKDRNEVRT